MTTAGGVLGGKRKTRVWAAAGIAAIAAIATGIHFIGSPKTSAIAATKPEYRTLVSSIATTGRVVPEHEFIARADVAGPIDSIDVQLGQQVVPGQLLVRMKDPYAATRIATARAALIQTESSNDNVRRGGSQEERMALQSDLARAEAEQSAAQNSLATLKRLQDSGAASAAEVRAATLRATAADQTLKFVNNRIAHRFSTRDVGAWGARVAEAQSSLKAAKASFANINITSPIAGTVYLLPATSNDFVGVGAELLRVADLQHLQVRANFEEAEISRLRVGAPVEIRWEGKPDHVWHGVVQHAPLAAVISGVRSFGESIISITDAHNDLPPNTTVNVTVVEEQRQHVLSVPREAIQRDGGDVYVYRVADGTLVRTPVVVGLLNLNFAQILQGIGPNDQVALHAYDLQALHDGMQVQVQR